MELRDGARVVVCDRVVETLCERVKGFAIGGLHSALMEEIDGNRNERQLPSQMGAVLIGRPAQRRPG